MRFRVVLPVALFTSSLLSFGQAVTGPEVAPGVVLPANSDAVVYALDTKASGPVLTHIVPHEVVLNTHAGGNLLRGFVYAGPHLTAEVEGLHAETVLSSAKAVLFVRLNGDDPELERGRIHVVWLQHNKKRREITDYSQNVFGGQRTRNVDEVPVDFTTVEGTNWVRVTPRDPLLPGEFAVVFIPKDANAQPTTAYDFSVPGTAGDGNPYALKADAKTPDK